MEETTLSSSLNAMLTALREEREELARWTECGAGFRELSSKLQSELKTMESEMSALQRQCDSVSRQTAAEKESLVFAERLRDALLQQNERLTHIEKTSKCDTATKDGSYHATDKSMDYCSLEPLSAMNPESVGMAVDSMETDENAHSVADERPSTARLSHAEFKALPAYLKQRASLESVNAMIDGMNDMWDASGQISESSLKKSGLFTAKNATDRSILQILRQIKRIKYISQRRDCTARFVML